MTSDFPPFLRVPSRPFADSLKNENSKNQLHGKSHIIDDMSILEAKLRMEIARVARQIAHLWMLTRNVGKIIPLPEAERAYLKEIKSSGTGR